jgi:tRNA-dihydrouridine synthase
MRTGVSGVLVGRGVLRNPWILAQASDLAAGRPARVVTMEERGQFLLDYIELLRFERVREATGFRHQAPGLSPDTALNPEPRPLGPTHDRWVINKTRALMSWYSKGLDGGSQLRVRVNSANSLAELRDVIHEFFMLVPTA